MVTILAIFFVVGAVGLMAFFLRWLFTSASLNDTGDEEIEIVPTVGAWRSPTVATTIVRPSYYEDEGISTGLGVAAGVLLAEELEAQRRAQMYPGYVEVPVVPQYDTPVYPAPQLDVPYVPQYDIAPQQLDVPAVPQYDTAPSQLDVPYVPSADTSYSSRSSDLDVPSTPSYDNTSVDTGGWSQDSSSYDSGSSGGGWD